MNCAANNNGFQIQQCRRNFANKYNYYICCYNNNNCVESKNLSSVAEFFKMNYF